MLKSSGLPCYETTQRAGDLVFVPSGWWHVVLNVTDTVALTQNFVSKANLPKVLKFCRDKPEQVSGTAPGLSLGCRIALLPLTCQAGVDLYQEFIQQLSLHAPAALTAAEQELSRPKSIWARLQRVEKQQGSDTQPKVIPFAFNFT